MRVVLQLHCSGYSLPVTSLCIARSSLLVSPRLLSPSSCMTCDRMRGVAYILSSKGRRPPTCEVSFRLCPAAYSLYN